MTRVFAGIALALFVGCQPSPRPAAPPTALPEPASLTILHTNDTHGQIWGDEEVGGSAQRATLVQRIRAEVATKNGAVVLLDAGDVRTGSYCSDKNEGRPDFEAMDAMGYDAMVLGNHELDLPLATTLEEFEGLGFPILGANVVAEVGGERPFQEHLIVDRGGLRIAVLGLATPETPSTSTRGAESGLLFLDPLGTAERAIPPLREQSNLVIVLSHLGLEEDRRLARTVPGIDVIVGGHTHHAHSAPEVEGATLIAHAGSGGQFLGRIDIEVTRGGVRLVEGGLLPVDAGLPAEPEVGVLLGRYRCPEAEFVVGSADAAITRSPLAEAGSSSAMAELVGRAFRHATGANLAVVNRGGLRADIRAGTVTSGELHATLPFDDHLVVLRASGENLLELARGAGSRGPNGRGMLLPSGMQWVVARDRSVTVTIDGEPVAPDEQYALAVSTFVAGGGDRYPVIRRMTHLRTVETTPAEALAELFQARGAISPDGDPSLRWRETSPQAPVPAEPAAHPASPTQAP